MAQILNPEEQKALSDAMQRMHSFGGNDEEVQVLKIRKLEECTPSKGYENVCQSAYDGCQGAREEEMFEQCCAKDKGEYCLLRETGYQNIGSGVCPTSNPCGEEF